MTTTEFTEARAALIAQLNDLQRRYSEEASPILRQLAALHASIAPHLIVNNSEGTPICPSSLPSS